MKPKVTEFRGIKFGEKNNTVRPLTTDQEGILWCDKPEQQKVGITLVSEIKYGFFKGKFLTGRIRFGGLDTFEILKQALTEKYGKPSEKEEFWCCWTIGDVLIELTLPNPSEGKLVYIYVPLQKELLEELESKKKDEMKMKVRAAKTDL